MRSTGNQFTLPVTGMHCASCAAGLERAFNRVPEISHVNVNIATHEAYLEGISIDTAIKVIHGAGYDVVRSETVLSASNENHNLSQESIDARCLEIGPQVCGHLSENGLKLSWIPGIVEVESILDSFPEFAPASNTSSRSFTGRSARLVVALSGALIIMILGMLIRAPHLVLWAIATPVVFYCGLDFFRSAWSTLLRGSANMYTLITVGVGAAWIYSSLVTFFPNLFNSTASVYFEAAAVIIALVLVGQFLESRAMAQTGSAIDALLKLQVPIARVQRGSHVVDLPLESVMKGDLVIIRPGDQVSVDGEVMQGTSAIDESMLTGEPLPVAKSQGSKVVAGTLNLDGSLMVCVTDVGRDTILQRIVTLTREAQGRKAPIQKLADQVSGIFVPVVIVIAILTFLTWILAGWGLEHALTTFVSVLIIACPCALGLATPAAVIAATGSGAQRGILFKGGDALERASRVTHVILDKTGTLTTGKPVVQSVESIPGYSSSEILQMAASLEAHSEHPLADAIVSKAKEQGLDFSPVRRVRISPGLGISGVIQKYTVLVGSSMFLLQEKVHLPKSIVEKSRIHVAIDGQWSGQISISDSIRSTSQDAVARLKDQGLHVIMLTGDTAENAEMVAQEVGISDLQAEVSPEGKLEYISSLGTQDLVTAMVGDGINDAPALAEADVGIAIGSGTQVAVETADVSLMREDLGSVANTILIGRKAMSTIRQNLFFAFVYNSLSIPIAAGAFYGVFGVLLNPMLASLAMMLSSLSVILNSLRLRNSLSV